MAKQRNEIKKETVKYIVQIAGITCEFDDWQEREDFIEEQKEEFGHTEILTTEIED